MEIEGKTLELFGAENVGAPLVVLNTFRSEGGAVWRACRTAGCPPFTLATVGGIDWDADMSPWAIPPISPRDTPCTGGADAYLALLEGEILPKAEARLESPPTFTAIAGYSLAGLFAVYSLYRTDRFARAASASGSMWFPRFREYALAHGMARRPEKLYFSLGDAEAKTSNRFLRTVQTDTEALVAHFRSLGIDTGWELNPGNHFQDGNLRTAKAIKSILQPPAQGATR